jgi:hypothetical protein
MGQLIFLTSSYKTLEPKETIQIQLLDIENPKYKK